MFVSICCFATTNITCLFLSRFQRTAHSLFLYGFEILLIINLTLHIFGVFMDITPAVLIYTPIFLPVVKSLGVDPTHFGIIMVMNLCIGLCTPPVGSVLFVGVGVAGTTIQKVVKPLLPLFLAMLGALLLVTFIPALSLWLPSIFGTERLSHGAI